MINIHKIIASLAGAALLIATLAIVAISFRAFSQIEKAADARKHTNLVINRANDLMSALKDAETGERGYLLTGDEAFLEPYLAVRHSIRGRLEELRKLTVIVAVHKHLDAMSPLIDAKLAHMARNIESRRNQNMPSVITDVSSGQGKRLMDSIRAEENSFIRIEEDALTRHEAEFRSNMRHLFVVIGASGLLTLLFALSFAYFIFRETQNRLRNLVHLETQHLLEIQENTNKQLQQANVTLQISEEKLAVTLNSIGDAVMATDAEGGVTLLNPLAEQLTGWTLTEAAGRQVDEIFHIINQETRQPADIPVKETLAHGTIQALTNHTILIARDGSERAIADSCAPIRNRDGQVIGAVLVFRDVTDRVAIEIGLEIARKELVEIKISEDDAREYAESIINTVREPLIALDQDLRAVTASRSFYEVFKVNPEETVGQLIYDLGNKQWDIPKLRELLETILPQKTSFDDYEVEHDFASIGRRIMLLNARQIQRVSGKERIILLAIEDITKRKEIENGLEKAHEDLEELAAELKRTTRVKSEFLANMSHELRTPLNSINGFSEVLYDETFGPLNEKQKKYVNNVLTSGKHLLLLINQILDMAKVEAGKMNLALSQLPMKSLLNDISMLIADMVSKKKIEMLLEIAEDLPDIEADDLKVKEVIYNLLSNAVKFTPEGGKIGMRAKKTDSDIEVEVWDTGDGIASENMEKIFEGFFRVDTPYSRVTEGTGLGLPLSKKLVELHGGKLSVVSEGLNKGALVRFTLPIVYRSVD
ncbi:MAG: CHASE3 domain-containing protein [bacterium]